MGWPERRLIVVILMTALFAACWPGGPAAAQTAPQPPPTQPPPTQPTDLAEPALSLASLRARLDALRDTDPAEAEVLRGAIAFLEQAESNAARAAEARAALQSAPEMLRQIREELAAPPSPPVPDAPPDATLAQLEQGEAQATASLAALRASLSELQAEAASRQDRRSQIPESLARLRPRLTEIDAALARPPADAPSQSLANARRLALAAERQAVASEIAALEAEVASIEARRDLLPARRDREARRVAQAEKLVAAWQQLVSDRRKVEAEVAAREAERQRRRAALQHPVLQEYAQETQRLAEQRLADGSPAQRIDGAKSRLSAVQGSLRDLIERYAEVSQRIQSSGLSRATGLTLRREFESLPNPAALYRRLETTRRELEEIEYTLFELDEQMEGSKDIGAVTAALLDAIEQTTPATDDLRAAAAELANARADVLSALAGDALNHQDVLIDLERESDRLSAAATAYEGFIRERILWVRSISSETPTDLDAARDAVAWLIDGSAWADAARKTWDDMLRRMPLAPFALAGIAVLIAAARWALTRLAQSAEAVGRYRTDRFAHTVSALAMSTLAATPAPVMLLWLSWVLSRPPDQEQVAIAVGEGLRTAGALLFPLAFVRVGLRRVGLAIAHFRWAEAPVVSLRRNLTWFTPVVLTAVALSVAFDHLSNESAAATLGRVAFSIAMIASAVFLQRIARAGGPIASEVFGPTSHGWMHRLRHAWPVLLAAVPIALMAFAWFGYYYTAVQLTRRLEGTVALAVVVLLANGMLLRWLFLARRRVAVEDAKRRREQATGEAEAPRADPAQREAAPAPIDVDKLDLPAISLQTRQLFRTALWLTAAIGLVAIWADVLPALRMLERVEVYPRQRLVATLADDAMSGFDRLVPAPSAQPNDPASALPASSPASTPASTEPGSPTSSQPALTPLTPAPLRGSGDSPADLRIALADLVLALLVLAITFVTFRNLPGLVEIMVLQRLPLDAGSRYALGTVLRYAIVIIGVALAFSAIHVSWSHVQWLAAALTFGLAFGLQEIFANFISGLIILAERPIRIGDTVTVGQVSGTVSRIRMRATTIMDWDRKELIIPNKTFITGEVINWTLTDSMLRVIIPVGIAYGSDVRKAEAVLLRVAAEQPILLRDPKPYVLFQRFGDSTLDLELRAFIPHVDQVLVVKHDLHLRIIEAFRAEGIEIAFPQRELHIRTIDDLPVESLVRGAATTAASTAPPSTPPKPRSHAPA